MKEFLDFHVQTLYVGSKAPYSPQFESLQSTPVEGLQSATVALNWPRQDVNDWSMNGNQELVVRPRAQLDFNYIFSTEVNDSSFGLFYNLTGKTSSAISNLNTETNFYLAANFDGANMIGYSGDTTKVISIGNGVLNSYSFNTAVGSPTTVSVGIEGLNMIIQSGTANQLLPSVYKQSGNSPTGKYSLPSAYQSITNYFDSTPKAIILNFDSGAAVGVSMSGQDQVPLDSFSFSIDIPREETKAIGWAYPEYRAVQWPVTINLSAQGTLNKMQSDTLNRYLCNDSGMSFSVGFKTNCNTIDNYLMQFVGAKLENQSFVAEVGNLNKVNMNWSLKIFDVEKTYPNFYINATGTPYNYVRFPQAGYVSGVSPLQIDFNTQCFIEVLSGPGQVVSGNYVNFDENPGTTILRFTPIDGSDPKEITITVT